MVIIKWITKIFSNNHPKEKVRKNLFIKAVRRGETLNLRIQMTLEAIRAHNRQRKLKILRRIVLKILRLRNKEKRELKRIYSKILDTSISVKILQSDLIKNKLSSLKWIISNSISSNIIRLWLSSRINRQGNLGKDYHEANSIDFIQQISLRSLED